MSSEKLGRSLAAYVSEKDNTTIPCITVAPHLKTTPLQPEEIRISSGRYQDANAAGVVIFTSGTTGPPKGCVMRRAYIHDGALSVSDLFQITPKDVMQHVLPVHHATGLGIGFFPFLISGACIEFRGGSFSPEWMWERWRRGNLTFLSAVPTMYMRMKRHFEQNIAKLAPHVVEEYVRGARQFKAMLCGTSALPQPIQSFWTNIRDGKVILTRYGATEFGAVFKMKLDPTGTPPGSVGEVISGVDVKLSESDEGEVLTRSSGMFSR